MFSFSCPQCDLNLMSADAEALADNASAHADYHAMIAEKAPVDAPRPHWTTGPKAHWDSIDPATGDHIRLWERAFNDYTPDLGDSRAMVDLIREDRLTTEGIVAGIETIQVAANFTEDEARGSIYLTADQARRVARDLLAAADVFDNPPRRYRRDENAIRTAAQIREDLQ